MAKTYVKNTISYESAATMVAAAVAKAEELGCKQNVAVVDDGGNLKAFGRMDGAPLLGVEGCQRKAFTALFGVEPKTSTRPLRTISPWSWACRIFLGRPWSGAGCPLSLMGRSSAGSALAAARSMKTWPARKRGSTRSAASLPHFRLGQIGRGTRGTGRCDPSGGGVWGEVAPPSPARIWSGVQSPLSISTFSSAASQCS